MVYCPAIAAALLALFSLLAAAAPTEPQPQHVFAQRPAQPDLVDVLTAEARARHIPLDAQLRPLAPTPHALGGGWSWTECAMEGHVVAVESIELQPDPPQRGQNLTIRARGTVTSLIDEGTFVDVDVRLGPWRVLSQRLDVCEEARSNNVSLQCPVDAGQYEVVHTVLLPSMIPPARLMPARFSVHVSGATQDTKPLVCMDIGVSFLFLSLRAWLRSFFP
ncbi:hypothetical protein MSPP1_000290 [Malassezia sp. CBS 17886]|nr:hypothetical protein MSPP1_000290 [Malassezia sp. CBS 17886]